MKGLIMSQVNYKTIPGLLMSRREYTHGSSHAKRSDTEYHVYSYSTLMLTYNLLSRKVTYYNSEYYSRTTSRLQGILSMIFYISVEES